MIAIRPATAADQHTIRRMIREAGINPMDLKWPNFVLAVDEATGEVVGTGQIKRHGDGTYELASIATVPAYQRRGIARQVIEHLMARFGAENDGPLYLMCMDDMGAYYARFGFREVPPGAMPPYFRRMSRLASALMHLDRQGRRLLVMVRGGGGA